MNPVAVATRIDQECCQGAVRLFFGGYGGQLDDDVGFLHQLRQHGSGVIGLGRVALEKAALRSS